MPTYVPDIADAQQDSFAPPTKFQTRAYAVNPPNRVTAQWDLKPKDDEILALIRGRVASVDYTQTFTCDAGLNVGDPVYVSDDQTVDIADSTDGTKASVIGWIRFKPTTTTCVLDHFHYVTGLTGFSAGVDVYLQDDSSYGLIPGTVSKVIGIATSATTAVLAAAPGNPLPGGSVTTAKIADGAVTSAKLSEAYCRWLGSSTGNPSAPNPGDIYKELGDGLLYQFDGFGWQAIS